MPYYARYRSEVPEVSGTTWGYPETAYSSRACGQWMPHSAGQVWVPTTRTKEMWDNLTPRFSALQKSGSYLPVNPMLKKETLISPVLFPVIASFFWECSCNPSKNDSGVTYNNYVIPFPQPSSQGLVLGEDDVGVLLRRSIAAAKEPLLDWLTTWKERQQTADYLADTTRKLARLLTNFKKQVRKLSRLSNSQKLDALADLRLQYRYAVMPLYHDARGAGEAIAQGAKTVARGYASTTRSESIVETQVSGLWFCDGLLESKRTITGELKSRAGAIMEAKLGDLALGLNPLNTAYETIPLSFVIEWFLDLSDVLTLLSPDTSTKVNGLWTSFQRSVKEHHECKVLKQATNKTGCGNNIYTLMIGTPVGEGHQVLSKQRDPRNWGDVSFIPKFEVKLNLDRLLDAAALLRANRSAFSNLRI